MVDVLASSNIVFLFVIWISFLSTTMPPGIGHLIYHLPADLKSEIRLYEKVLTKLYKANQARVFNKFIYLFTCLFT